MSAGAADATEMVLAGDGDAFMLAVPGATGHVVRTGRGTHGISSVTTAAVGVGRVARLNIGFPTVAEAEADPDTIVLLTTQSHTPLGGRWDGIPVTAGQTFVYPPGASHHAHDPDGLVCALTAVPAEAFRDAATTLGIDPQSARGGVTWGGPMQRALSSLMSGNAYSGAIDGGIGEDLLLEAVVRTACAPARTRPSNGFGRRSTDLDIVQGAISFLEASPAWQVSTITVCRQVSVSERRLQLAFRRILDVTLQSYMCHRALQAAHIALLESSPTTQRVSTIADAHGFHHHGRFADLYRRVYGDHPRITLRRPPKAVLESDAH